MSPVARRSTTSRAGGWSSCSASPPDTDVAFVTGATVANASCLAAARDALLGRARLGRASATGCSARRRSHVVVGERAHSTLRKSLGLVGLGRDRVTIVPADDQGRMRADLLPDLDGRRTGAACAPRPAR